MNRPGLTVGLAALLIIAALPASAKPYQRGQIVVFAGQVTDPSGAPVADVSVLLEASRRSFRLSRVFQRKNAARQKTDTLVVPTTTGADGSYRLDWPWDPYYDTFELAVAVSVTVGGRPTFEVFERRDITPNVTATNPVITPLTLDTTAYFDWLRRFVAGSASEDQQRIFQEMGRPERIEEHPRRDGRTESAWFYFQTGKVYRFLDGILDQVLHVEPVLQPGESTPGESTPGESTPGESTPGESTPGESPPGESTPGPAAGAGSNS